MVRRLLRVMGISPDTLVQMVFQAVYSGLYSGVFF